VNEDIPASDLVYPQAAQSTTLPPECRLTNTLPSDCAQILKNSGVDLSTLDPDTSTDLWKGPSSAADESLDQALALSENQETNFVGVIESSAGRFRFNVRTDAGAQPAQTLTLMVGTTLHTFLMRKELFRRLGYVIPPMKYLHSVKVKFDNIKDRDDFLNKQFQVAIGGPDIGRWIPELAANKLTTALELTFQDVAVMQATPLIYNLAIGIPIQQIPGSNNLRAEQTRVLKAAAIPAGLADVVEDINLYDWSLGQIQNQAVAFHTPDQAIYGCTDDDAVWMLRRLAKLTREDFVAIVANSYYPDPIAKVIVEKLISRRNTILSIFNVQNDKISYDKSPTQLPGLKSGKVLQQDWTGYGGFFDGKDPVSPLHGLQWYIVSEVASNAMTALLTQVNNELPGLTTQNVIANHEIALQNKLIQYLLSGETPPMNIGAWVLPIVNGSVNISRDVVLGNYMGTNNPVQLADSFGFTANVGLYAGVDNPPTFLNLSGLAEGTASISFTHVKPLNTWKKGITEPVKNEFVPWLMAHGAGILNAAEAVKAEPSGTPQQIQKAQTDLKADLDKIDDFLAPGDSLIVTESINGLEQASAGLQARVWANPALQASLSANQEVIWRLNFFRSADGGSIQIFKDDGRLVNVIASVQGGISKISTNGQVSPVFPVVSVMGKKASGKVRSEIFNVNIGLNQGEHIYPVINALNSALTRGSVEQLEGLQKPLKPLRLAIGFKDSTSEEQFFHLIHRTLKSDGQITLQTPDGAVGNYLYIQDGKQSGKGYQQLVTQAATYLAQIIANSSTETIDTQAPQNPGQSFLGVSHTRNASFEARIINKGITQPSVGIQYRWEGFNISQKDMVALVAKLSNQYGFKLFNDGFLNDTKAIKMYALDLNVNLYEAALGAILNMSDADSTALEKRYSSAHHCNYFPDQIDQMSGQDEDVCNALNKYEDALKAYKKGKFKNASDQGTKGMAVASDLEQLVTFTDLVNIVGGTANIYLNATLTGYRDGSEVPITTPINSNTYGTPDPVGGIVDAVENEPAVNLQSGEFDAQWMRDIL
jgi:hypothetical protein